MKKMFISLVLTVACMGLGVAFAEEKTMTQAEKDECLLISKNCQNASLTLQEKMKKLQEEIKKGTKVYSAEDLKRLESKLKEAEQTLDYLMTH